MDAGIGRGLAAAPATAGLSSETFDSLRRRTGAPATGATAKRSAPWEGARSVNRIRVPSAVQAGDARLTPLASSTRPVPSELMTFNRFCASLKELTNAILVPSGENAGSDST